MNKKQKFVSILITLIMLTICLGNQQISSSELSERISKMENDLEALRMAALQAETNVQSESKEKRETKTGAPWKLNSKTTEKKEISTISTSKVEKETPAVQVKNPVIPQKSPVVKIQNSEGYPIWSNLDIQLYGFVKLDASYDTSLTYPGNFTIWVNSESSNEDDDGFNITAKQTRLGLKINGPDNGDVKTSGLVEFDFYGSSAPENKGKVQLRKAYLQIDWPDDSFSLIAGQNSDVFSPLVPTTLNYTVLWGAGNIGYRRPQIRFTKNWKNPDKSAVKFEVALARTVGRSNTPYAETGMDAGYPTVESRLGISFPMLDYKPTTIGFSGHIGREEYDIAANGDNKKFESWSANFDLTQPVNKWFTLKGEFFTGENLGTYFGGILQGVNTTTLKEISSKGGWVAISLGPWDNWSFNFGGGVDDVDRDDVGTGSKISNSSIFGNFIYSINSNTQVGFELSQWKTAYKDQLDADNTRAQMSFIYKF
jgi:hypothetical protein